jgi:multicomponent K+:H+ antiporter subunit G
MMTGSQIFAGQRMSFLPSQCIIDTRASDPDSADLLVLAGAGFAPIGSLGLLRLGSFYERVHAPTIGTTFGTAFIILCSILCFSILQTRPLVHEILIALFTILTTPVTLMLLARAAIYRDRMSGSLGVPPRENLQGAIDRDEVMEEDQAGT